jgi:hypothetical protein
MSRLSLKALQAAAGAAAGEAVYVDDVFSTYLYAGTQAAGNVIDNGINLDESDDGGGLVWLKARNHTTTAGTNFIIDSQRLAVGGAGSGYLRTNATNAATTGVSDFSFNTSSSTGFTVGATTGWNASGVDYASWTFRKQPGFFDIVTWTGDGVSGRAISHNLGCEVGTIFVKNLNATSNWYVYHRSLTSANYGLKLNGTDAEGFWGTGNVTNTTFSFDHQNSSGQNYVAYLFAHDAQDFGTGSDESIIKCGSYTGTGSAQDIDLGFEPQWILIKRASASASWTLLDSMRGIVADGNDPDLHPNDTTYDSQQGAVNFAQLNADGIKIDPGSNGYTGVNASGSTYIYIAIRRPHKPAEEFAATDLFEMDYDGGAILNNSAKDLMFNKNVTSSVYFEWGSRIQGTNCLNSGSSGAEFSAPELVWSNKVLSSDGDGRNYYMFRRAPGFMDVVAYTGTGAEVTVPHNLGVVPELIINKARTSVSLGGWYSLCTLLSSGSQLVRIDSTSAASSEANLFPTAPTSENYYVDSLASYSGASYISYLFATVPGISKVGSYSGTGTNQNIDCGFSSGARFVVIKRTDSSGPWEVYSTDIFKGINAGAADQHNFWNTNTRVYTEDNLDPYSGGFRVNGTASADVNASGGSYIFLAIA